MASEPEPSAPPAPPEPGGGGAAPPTFDLTGRAFGERGEFVVDGPLLAAAPAGDGAPAPGMGTLWRVHRTPPRPGDEPRELVLKRPRAAARDDPAAIVGFEVEQMLLPALRGPHVPHWVAHGEAADGPWLVMERIEGQALSARLPQLPLPIDEVVSIGVRVAEALHDVHRQGVVHLDLKPSNVIERANGVCVLVDWGLARSDRHPDLLHEDFRVPLGTAPYISPEQVQGVRDDPRSDLFALAAMLYFFTTGVRPFGSPLTHRGLRERLHAPPVPPRRLRPDCPPWLQELLLLGLEADAGARIQSAAQFALALRVPEQITLGERAQRLDAPSRWRRLTGRLSAEARRPAPPRAGGAAGQLARSPIVMAAVDIGHGNPALLARVRDAVGQVLAHAPGARLACVAVVRAPGIAVDDAVDAQGHGRHMQARLALKHWARALEPSAQPGEHATRLPADAPPPGPSRLTFHVIESADPADALLAFAERTRVDHIVMGARGASALRRYLGSVSAKVVARAHCTVTVVRV